MTNEEIEEIQNTYTTPANVYHVMIQLLTEILLEVKALGDAMY